MDARPEVTGPRNGTAILLCLWRPRLFGSNEPVAVTAKPTNPLTKFDKFGSAQVTEALLHECAALFSSHYGTWADDFPVASKRGQRIQLSAKALLSYLPGDDSWIVTARSDGRLIGYAMAIWARSSEYTISWVTQLVVHEDYRHQGIATTLLGAVWGHSNHLAWGIVSANPYAIRVLEKATRRSVVPHEVAKHDALIRSVFERIPYLNGAIFDVAEDRSIVDTNFRQDLSSVPEKLAQLVSQGAKWQLGNLLPGNEWLGATFQSQASAEWTQEEADRILVGARDIAQQAYERMAAANPELSHPWAKHAPAEVHALLKQIDLPSGARVLDFGCGSGRHSIEFALKGHTTFGIDGSSRFIDEAKKRAQELGLTNTQFLQKDGLDWATSEQYDLGLCLYDVIGSYPVDALNERLFQNLVKSVRPLGWVVFSVMSYDFLLGRNPTCATSQDVHLRLAALKPSNAMERSGEVFDGRYIVLDTERRIAYRKEQFGEGPNPPLELLIADRRYGLDELAALCRRYDLEPRHLGYVSAGRFEPQRDSIKKEILVIAQKGG